MTYYERVHCINCGQPIMGDDAGGWLHENSGFHTCAIVFVATPPPKGLA